jgi:hypothetical protein
MVVLTVSPADSQPGCPRRHVALGVGGSIVQCLPSSIHNPPGLEGNHLQNLLGISKSSLILDLCIRILPFST